ncbi:TonB-dependent siderophore receptor [Draconibacterium sediminis]|uniref:TonB-dependent receptor plug domain-containing protein n=1 Tax=Draconibacterium sediminis TaxID=1544798 RepID=UPI0026F06B8E|nr:TonB-dependent receptor [Draconibacterium sediminis]
MQKILLAISCINFFTISTFSQKCIKGIVTNEANHVVSFATVSDGLGHGTMADSLGNFEFCFPSNHSPDEIIVTAVGYIADTVPVTKATQKLTVELAEDVITINEVAIIHQQNIKDKSMTSAFTTNKKEMALLNPQNVSEVLQTKTGFTNRSGYQTPLTLRGMSGKHLLVLRNGMRRFSSYPSGYMSHTVNVYDLERIDVEKGAASVLYGAGAMGGIINLVDKSPFKQKGFNARFTSGYGSVNNEKNILACGGWSNGKLAFKTVFRYRDADDFTYADGTTAENSFYSDKDMFFSAGYQFSETQQLVFTADMHDGGPWGKPVGFNGTKYMRVKTNEERSDNLSLQYNVGLGRNGKLNWNVFYSNESRILEKNYYTAAGYMLSYVETTHFSDYYYGSRLTTDWKVTNKYSITAGSDFYSFHISTPVDVVDYIEAISFQNRVSHNARSYISGSFIEHKLQLTNTLKLVGGIRYDYGSVYEGDVHSIEQDEERNEAKHALSGNIAAAFRFANHSRIKVNVARSFRMPETTELYADSYTSNGILYANPDLQPEYSNSVDLVYTQSIKKLEIEFSPFLWLMEGMITKEEFKGMPGTNYQFVNIGKTRLWGSELTAEIPVKNVIFSNDKLQIAIGMAYLNGTDVTEAGNYFKAGTPLNYIPPFNAKANITYHTPESKKVEGTFALRAVYYAEQKRLGDKNYATPAYLTLGTTFGIDFNSIKTKPSLNIAINNLLNKEYYTYYSYLPAEGRDVRLFLTFHFN